MAFGDDGLNVGPVGDLRRAVAVCAIHQAVAIAATHDLDGLSLASVPERGRHHLGIGLVDLAQPVAGVDHVQGNEDDLVNRDRVDHHSRVVRRRSELELGGHV